MQYLNRTVAALLLSMSVAAAELGQKGGPEPADVEAVASILHQDPYDLELLISYGTSKGGSAGHLALAIRDEIPGDDLVHSANFYADRAGEHAKGFYNTDLMVRIPKLEYLFKTSSSVAADAAFGLDFGEVYKRSVIGVRVYGVPAAEKAALSAYFTRINDDYQRGAEDTEYHDGEVKYGYMHLNCAKTVGAAFKYGAGYRKLEVKSPWFLPSRPIAAIANSNTPTEMAVKLIKEWNFRGYGLDVVFYRKYDGSTYVDPHEEAKIAFKDLPNRFPSVLSLDFRNDAGDYEDYNNLLAMYLLYNLSKYSVRIDGATQRLEIEATRTPMSYTQAINLAELAADDDSRGFFRRLVFRPRGKKIGEDVEPAAAK